MDSLVAFIDEQMGRAPAKKEKLVEEPEIAIADEGLYILGEKSFAKHIEKGSHFIKFYAPGCGHCKKMAPTWDELAKDVSEDKTVSTTIAKVDCTVHQSICQDTHVKHKVDRRAHVRTPVTR
jgi:thioredoxin domain-containing protein 5